MIDLTKYGYKSRAAFLRDTPSMQTFIDISNDSNWGIAKSVLLHKHCPIDIRIRFTKSDIWYKRFVAYFTSTAPSGFFKLAENDMERNIQRVYKEHLDFFTLYHNHT